MYRFDDALAPLCGLAVAVGHDPRRRVPGRALHRPEPEGARHRARVDHVPLRARPGVHTATPLLAPARRAEVARHVAAELWKLANAAEAGSDEQFQLAGAYLAYGEEGDAEFAANVRGLLDGTVTLPGLEIDNNFRWSLIKALATVNLIDEDGIEAELARRDTTENREFALGARASRANRRGQGVGVERGHPQRVADQHAARGRRPRLHRREGRAGRTVRRPLLR